MSVMYGNLLLLLLKGLKAITKSKRRFLSHIYSLIRRHSHWMYMYMYVLFVYIFDVVFVCTEICACFDLNSFTVISD